MGYRAYGVEKIIPVLTVSVTLLEGGSQHAPLIICEGSLDNGDFLCCGVNESDPDANWWIDFVRGHKYN